MPSLSKSSTATDVGASPTGKLVAEPKLPSPFPDNTDTLSELLFATARSGMPSPLKSSAATDRGLLPTGKLVAEPKPPSPFPNNTDTLSSQ